MKLLDLARSTDEWGEQTDRVRAMSKSQAEYNRIMRETIATAKMTGTAFADNVDQFDRLNGSAKELGASTAEILTFNRAVQQIGVIAHGTDETIRATKALLTSSLTEGTLNAGQFMQALKNAPELAKYIAQGLEMTPRQLLAAVTAGRVLSRDVFEALIKQAPQIGDEFEKVPTRLTRATQELKTALMAQISAYNENLNATKSVASGIQTLAKNVDLVFKGFLALRGLSIPVILSGIGKAADATKAAFVSLGTIIRAHPLIFIATVIATIITTLMSFSEEIGAIGGGMATVADYIAAAWDAIKEVISATWDFIKATFKSGVDYISNAGSSVGVNWGEVFRTLGIKTKEFVNIIIATVVMIPTALYKAVEIVDNSIRSLFKHAADYGSAAWQDLKDKFTGGPGGNVDALGGQSLGEEILAGIKKSMT
jgi:hypothetical protein